MKNMLVEDMYQMFVHLWKKKNMLIKDPTVASS